jgi:hypothetical protein
MMMNVEFGETGEAIVSDGWSLVLKEDRSRVSCVRNSELQSSFVVDLLSSSGFPEALFAEIWIMGRAADGAFILSR